MEMGYRQVQKQDFRFRCFVCLEPFNCRPRTELPVDVPAAVNDLREGRKPTVCCSCGGEVNFKKKRAAFRRYLQFLAMFVPDDSTAEELELMG